MVKIDTTIRSGIKTVDEYIESLEKINGSNIQRLISACDDMAGIIADDVIRIAKSKNDDEIDNELQMLGSKKNKIYERFLSLIGSLKNFKAISEMTLENKPPVPAKKEKIIDTAIIEKEEPMKNMMEEMQLKIKQKHGIA